jgi:diguanylate cyclase (GGDEF)-like protein
MDEKGITQLLKSPAPSEAEAPPVPSGRLYLVVLSGGIPGAMLPLIPGSNGVGRSPENALQLAESSISRRHAVFHVGADQKVELTDLGSTNGTHLNNQRLEPNRPATIREGDRIRFGSTVVLKFMRPDPEEERFQREMFERTVRDPLTGLFNRAYFLDQIGPLIQHATAGGSGLSVLMLDIDRFKQFNDTYGHDVGDSVLIEVAHVLRQTTRSVDLVARYGGEEFLLALPVPSIALALARGEHIRATLAARRLRLESASVQVTASIGVAYSPADRPRAASSLISTADLHLDQAKQAGRNRVVGPLPRPTPPPGSQSTFEYMVMPLAPVAAGSTCELDDSAFHPGLS